MALPDVVKSTIEYLKAVPEVAAIVGTGAGWQPGSGGSGARISGALGDKWKVPTQAIVIRRAGIPRDELDGWLWERLDVWCYGANGLESSGLWRVVDPAICPDQSGVTGWVAANCRVANVIREAGPTPADDLDVGWSILIATYQVKYRKVPES